MWSQAPTTLGSTAERASLIAWCKPTILMTEPRLSKASWKREKGSEGLSQTGQRQPLLSTNSQPKPDPKALRYWNTKI